MQVMMTIGQGRLMHLVNCVKKVRIQYRRFGHTSNARIIWASKLLIGISNFGKNYNPVEIYSDSEASKPEKSLDDIDFINNDLINTNIAIETQYGISMKAFHSGNIYTAILVCEKTRKSQVLYLQLKDKFVNTCQI